MGFYRRRWSGGAEKGIYGTSFPFHFKISRGFGLAFGELRTGAVYGGYRCTVLFFGQDRCTVLYYQLSLSAERGRGKCQVGISNVKPLIYKSSPFSTETLLLFIGSN